MKMKMTQKKSAFTLIELLVVVAIIGILAAVGVPAYSGYQASAKAKANLNQVSSVTSLIANEAAKVSMGGTSNILGTAATLTDPADIVNLPVFDDFKNPYNPSQKAIVTPAIDNCADGSALLGQIGIVLVGRVYTISSCDTSTDGNATVKNKTITIE